MIVIPVDKRVVHYGVPVNIGVLNDNDVETIAFQGLPTIGEAQTAYLEWYVVGSAIADAPELTLADGLYTYTIPASMTQYGGRYIKASLHVATSAMDWYSTEFAIIIEPRTPTTGSIAAFVPDAFAQLLAEITAARNGLTTLNERIESGSENYGSITEI